MFKNLFILFSLVFLVSCNCQKSPNTDDNNQDLEISSEKIKGFLVESNFEIVVSSNLFVVYNIEKTLIAGTTNEYSNKVLFRDTLQAEKSETLRKLLVDDTSYDWVAERNQDFDPTLQILVRNDAKRIFLLVDEKRKKLGFINLEGQRVTHLSDSLLNFLKNL